jgi:xanthine dehydrogenase accessory factor
MFETRMSRRGFDQSHFADMTCPIGVEGISSKAPAAIAISVAGELLQVYDQSVSANNNNQKLGRAR